MARLFDRTLYYPSFIVELLVKAYMVYQEDRSNTKEDAILEAREYLTTAFNAFKIRHTDDEEHFNEFLDKYFPKPIPSEEVELALGQIWVRSNIMCEIVDIYMSETTKKPVRVIYSYKMKGVTEMSEVNYFDWHKQFRFVSNKEGGL